MLDSMMPMTVTTAVIVGFVLLLVVLVGLYIVFRVMGQRTQQDDRVAKPRQRRRDTKRPTPR